MKGSLKIVKINSYAIAQSSNISSMYKILNDPIHGFITIPYSIVFDIIEHPYFQRLRRITQLGLTNIVYSGANHTRFQHTLGAMHLTERAIETLRSKGVAITDNEAQGVVLAILLHDIGHGPFSHTLERSIIRGVSHETLSKVFMADLNRVFNGKLDLAIEIFNGSYRKKFLHQLVSSQLDMDRLDYLKRDSFFTGVSEGVVGSERIIKMLTVRNDELAIEQKGIYSIEKFLIARRLMYWQVYLHKTVLSAEFLLMKILQRAKNIAQNDQELFATPALEYFLYHNVSRQDVLKNKELLHLFARLDDFDVLTSIKVWQDHEDPVLSELCTRLIDRRLLKVKLQNEPFTSAHIQKVREEVKAEYGFNNEELSYFVFSDRVSNSAYSDSMDGIKIARKDGSVAELSEDADLININALAKAVEKYFLCFPSYG